MKFAFSTVACPGWDFAALAAKAKEYGYAAVEVRGFLNESGAPSVAADVFSADPAFVRDMFAAQGIEIACLSSGVATNGRAAHDQRQMDDARRYVDVAQRLGCRLVKVMDRQVAPGTPRERAAVELGHWLVPLGDYAAERGVSIVVENQLSFRTAKELWLVLESAAHPAVAAAWDVFNAEQIGEGPTVSVPVLNSRIQYVHVKDAKLAPQGATLCKLGEGDVPVRQFLGRLMGIGYRGWVTFEWERAWLANIAPPEEALPAALEQLRAWTTRPAPAAKPEKPAAGAAAAAAKKPAPAPAATAG